jgi:hypothetical protein
MATLSSLASIVPDPSVSNKSKASRISCFCSSVSSNFLLFVAAFLDAYSEDVDEVENKKATSTVYQRVTNN